MRSVSTRFRIAVQACLSLLAVVSFLFCHFQAAGAEAPQKKPATPKKTQKAKKKLSGAELYEMHCNRCHPERYAPERTEAQWQTILLHMRTRANLPAGQAKAILKYLQEDSGK